MGEAAGDDTEVGDGVEEPHATVVTTKPKRTSFVPSARVTSFMVPDPLLLRML